MIKKCKYCGKEFETHKKNVVFCCDECKKQYQKEYLREYYRKNISPYPEKRAEHTKSSIECIRRRNARERSERFMVEAKKIYALKSEEEVFNYIIKTFNMRGEK